MKTPVRFATCGDYTDMAVRLFKSIRHAYPDSQLHYEALCKSDQHTKRMKKLGVDVTHIPNFSCPPEWPFADDKPAVMRAWRTLQITRLLEEHNEPVLWLDSDSVVRKPFDCMLEQASLCDIAVCERKDQAKAVTPRKRVLSGVVLLMPTTGTKLLLDRWFHLCGSTRVANNHTDQLALWYAICQSRVRMLDLRPADFNDWYGYTQGKDPYIVSWPRWCWHKKGWKELSNWAESLSPE